MGQQNERRRLHCGVRLNRYERSGHRTKASHGLYRLHQPRCSFLQHPQEALNKDMAHGRPNPSLPVVHKEALELIRATCTSQDEAATKITSGLEDFYRSKYPAVWNAQRTDIDQAGKTLVTIYSRNVFP
jgi:hypothetical protein